jgi:hypothetical protein
MRMIHAPNFFPYTLRDVPEANGRVNLCCALSSIEATREFLDEIL